MVVRTRKLITHGFEMMGAMVCEFIFMAQGETAKKIRESCFQRLGRQLTLNASYLGHMLAFLEW